MTLVIVITNLEAWVKVGDFEATYPVGSVGAVLAQAPRTDKSFWDKMRRRHPEIVPQKAFEFVN